MSENTFTKDVIALNVKVDNKTRITALNSKLSAEFNTQITNLETQINSLLSQYNTAKNTVETAISEKSPSSHSHTTGKISGLKELINGKAHSSHSHPEYSPATHTHTNHPYPSDVNTSGNGPNENKIPYIKSDGVMEVSRYIDMHNVGNTSSDYNCRIEWNGASLRIDSAVSISGTLQASMFEIGSNGSLDANTKTQIANWLFPVGTVVTLAYSNTSNPADIFGVGTWEKITNKFLYCYSSSGSTGGEEKHPLTVNELPSHSHGYRQNYSRAQDNTGFPDGWNDGGGGGGGNHNYWRGHFNKYNFTRTTHGQSYTNVGSGHNNIPQTMKVRAWRRIA